MQFRVLGYVVTLNARATKLEKEVMGIRSNLDKKSIYNNGLHILMMDFDDVPREMLIRELIEIQHRHKLGDAEVFQSSMKTVYTIERIRSFPFLDVQKRLIKKWHVYFFQDPMTYWKAIMIIHGTNGVDESYKRWRMIRPNMVLRLSPKSDGFVPRPIFTVTSPYVKPNVNWFRDQVYEFLKKENELNEEKRKN